MSLRRLCPSRFLRTLLILPISVVLALPSPAFALRQVNAGMEESPVNQELHEQFGRATSGLEEPATPAATPKKPKTLGLTRRQWLKVGVTAAFGAGLLGWGKWEYGVDRSFAPKPWPLSLGDVLRAHPVWEPVSDRDDDRLLQALTQVLTTAPPGGTDPEAFRRASHTVRALVMRYWSPREVAWHGERSFERDQGAATQFLQQVAVRHSRTLLALADAVDPAAFRQFGVQWEALQC